MIRAAVSSASRVNGVHYIRSRTEIAVNHKQDHRPGPRSIRTGREVQNTARRAAKLQFKENVREAKVDSGVIQPPS